MEYSHEILNSNFFEESHLDWVKRNWYPNDAEFIFEKNKNSIKKYEKIVLLGSSKQVYEFSKTLNQEGINHKFISESFNQIDLIKLVKEDEFAVYIIFDVMLFNEVLKINPQYIKNGQVVCPVCESENDGGRLDKFITDVGGGQEDRKVLYVVIVYNESFPSTEFVIETLKENSDFYLVGIYLISPPKEGLFDLTIHLCGSLKWLIDILEKVPSGSFYVQSHGKWVFLGPCVKKIREKDFIIHEIYDWFESLSVAHLNSLVSEDLCEEIIKYERMTLETSDLIVFKNGGKWIEGHLEKYKEKVMKILPSPPKSFYVPVKRKKNKNSLVFCGRIAPSSEKSIFYDDIKFLSLFKEISSQGLSVNAFCTPIYSKDQALDLYLDYFEESKKNVYFQFEYGRSQNEIINYISRYGFGLLLSKFTSYEIENNHLKTAFASKLFTYLSAGLPMIINEELECMASFVLENKIGIVIKQKDISNLYHIIEKADYPDLLNNVQETRLKYSMDNQVAPLSNIIIEDYYKNR